MTGDPPTDHTVGAPEADPDGHLIETLRLAQRLGMLGPMPIGAAIAHARAFVAVLDTTHGRVVDLGSGAGLPGLVIAHDRPDLEAVLVDRRAKRADALERAVRRLGMADRVSVRCEDVRDTIQSEGAVFDAVTARSFGPPETTLAFAAALRAPHGVIVISDPPAGDRWADAAVDRLGLTRVRRGPVTVFTPWR